MGRSVKLLYLLRAGLCVAITETRRSYTCITVYTAAKYIYTFPIACTAPKCAYSTNKICQPYYPALSKMYCDSSGAVYHVLHLRGIIDLYYVLQIIICSLWMFLFYSSIALFTSLSFLYAFCPFSVYIAVYNTQSAVKRLD